MSTFRQTDERTIAGEMSLMRWNPRMDLMVFAMKNGEVALHRLSGWQRVWSLPPFVITDTQEASGETRAKKDVVPVTVIEWRPDGKVLAIAYANDILNLSASENLEDTSSIALVDVENAEVIHVIQVPGTLVTSLCWSQKPKSGHHTEKYPHPDYTRYIPKLKSLSKAFPGRQATSVVMRKLTEDNLGDLMRVSDNHSLNVLAVGTRSGEVIFYSLGLLNCGKIALPEAYPIRQIAFSKDLGFISILAETQSVAAVSKSFSFFNYSIEHLKAKSSQFMAVASIYANVITLLRYANETISAVNETWDDIMLEIDAKLSNYVQQRHSALDVEAADSTTLLADEFMELLVFGTATDQLEKFLTGLSTKGLKKLGQSIELTYSNIQKYVVMNLQRVAQHLVCHLTILKGVASWDIEFGDVGLDIVDVNSSMKAVGGLLMKSLELQQVVDTSIRNVKIFFRWLYTIMNRLYAEGSGGIQEVVKVSQQDLQFVAEFIEENFVTSEEEKKEETDLSILMEDSSKLSVTATDDRPTTSNFTLERVGQYLKNADLTHQNCSSNNFDLNPWISYLRERPHFPRAEPDDDLATHFILYPHHTEKSLIQEHNVLQDTVGRTFAGISKMFDQKVSVHSAIRNAITISADLEAPAKQQLPKCSQVSSSSELLVAFANTSLPVKQIFVVKHLLDSNGKQLGAAPCFSILKPESDMEECLLVQDFEFYSPDIMTLLLSEIPFEGQPAVFYLTKVPMTMMFPAGLDSANSNSDGQSPPLKIVLTTSDYKDKGLISFLKIESFKASRLAVSSSRKIACIVSASSRRMRIFETEVAEDEEWAEVTDRMSSLADNSETHANSSFE